MSEELNTAVTIKHTNESGAVLWEQEYRAPSVSAADVRIKTDDERALVSWPTGMALFYMRPGERIEILSTDVDSA